MNKDYEAVILLDADLDDEAVKSEIAKIETVVKAHGGELKKVDIWGRRHLAYQIRKKEFAIYVLIVLDGDSELVANLERQLKINEVVMRHMFVSKDKYAPDLAIEVTEQTDEDDTGAPSEKIDEPDTKKNLEDAANTAG